MHATAAHPEGLAVLLVDDEQCFRAMMRASLDDVPGLTVVAEAGNGKEAIARAAQLQPDLVVLDIAMPIMDGLQALPGIRDAAPNCRVLVLSGFDADVVQQRALSLGACAYLHKGTLPGDIAGTLFAIAAR